ncbi:PREDICTED: proteinase T-like [Branchiostoma belcheri]|uniref:Proteinase T-like n=1 Tax=Branchiostoma belcheri TaxID=7741 RepID=A0A6P4YZM5_BRABE|nr:PREDICTED: proteinase T-like [Branchiostoma belcheri]
MKSLRVLAVLAAVLGVAMATAPLLRMDSKTAIPNEYIVVLHKNLTDYAVGKHMNNVKTLLTGTNDTKILFEHNFRWFKAYSIRTNMKMIHHLAEQPEVRYIEANQVMKAYQAQCQDQLEATWGLVRTVERDLLLDGIYHYQGGDGEGVDAYIIDTGIYTEHSEFGGRAKWGVDTVDTPSPETDENGHGTHVAGTVMSDAWGLAKKATAIAVKVLSRSGSGSTAGVIEGVEWTGEQHQGNNKKSVANMSLGGGRSDAMNEAVKAVVEAGVIMVVAAGNEGWEACNVSPASEPTAVTVGCSDNEDDFCFFSNYGTCMDIIAPGMDVTSAWIGGQFADNTISGTSMSAPHIAGIVAKYLSRQSTVPSPKEVKDFLQNTSTKDKINMIPSNSDTLNYLSFMDCGGGPDV